MWQAILCGGRVMKKRHITLAVLLLLAGLAYAYFERHGMSRSPSYERGLASLPQRVLIAAQDSPFKDQLVAKLVAELERRPVFVRVIDVTGLAREQPAEWRAIVILHTWEFGKPPAPVRSFLAQPGAAARVVDVATSGSGREKIEGVDAISSASVIDETPALVQTILARIDAKP